MATGNRMPPKGYHENEGLAWDARTPEIQPMKPRLPTLALALGFTFSQPVRAQESALVDAARAFESAIAFDLDTTGTRVADFNGDGLPDAAAILVAPERRALVVFNAREDGSYATHPLYTVLPPGDVELRLVSPGRHRVLGPQRLIEHTSPGVELVFPGRASALYIWRGGRYQVFGTENY